MLCYVMLDCITVYFTLLQPLGPELGRGPAGPAGRAASEAFGAWGLYR